MSRYTVPAGLPGFEVFVGHDGPMGTYFAQVLREQVDDDPHDPVVLWLGVHFGEVQRPEDMVAPLAPYAELTEEHLAQLRADGADALDRAPSPLQREMMRLLKAGRGEG